MIDPWVEVPDIKAFPCTESREEGEVVPMPTLPFCKTTNDDPVVPPTNKVEVAIRDPTVEVPDIKVLPCTLKS